MDLKTFKDRKESYLGEILKTDPRFTTSNELVKVEWSKETQTYHDLDYGCKLNQWRTGSEKNIKPQKITLKEYSQNFCATCLNSVYFTSGSLNLRQALRTVAMNSVMNSWQPSQELTLTTLEQHYQELQDLHKSWSIIYRHQQEVKKMVGVVMDPSKLDDLTNTLMSFLRQKETQKHLQQQLASKTGAAPSGKLALAGWEVQRTMLEDMHWVYGDGDIPLKIGISTIRAKGTLSNLLYDSFLGEETFKVMPQEVAHYFNSYAKNFAVAPVEEPLTPAQEEILNSLYRPDQPGSAYFDFETAVKAAVAV